MITLTLASGAPKLRYYKTIMTAELAFVRFRAQSAASRGIALSSTYERLALAYVASLLFIYPYGVALGSSAAVRASDVAALGCLALGASAVLLRGSLSIDTSFFRIVGPFLLMELAYPLIGGIAYDSLGDVVSTARMATLWLPIMLLGMLLPSCSLPRFERRFCSLLRVALWANAGYAILQIGATLGWVPRWILVTELLEPWAVEDYYNLVQGIRPAGFFANSTALAVFGIVCLCYFYARYVSVRQRGDLIGTLLSLFVILISTSRAAFAAAGLIGALGWLVLSRPRKVVVFSLLVLSAAAFAILVEETIGLAQLFARFIRIADSGLLADASFGRRLDEIWPAALEVAESYPLGSYFPAQRITHLIDSGYLNYYVQGRWLFIAAVAAMLGGQFYLGLRCLRRPDLRASSLMLLFITLFLTLGMITSNPARAPLVIAFLAFAHQKLRVEREGRWVTFREVPDRIPP